MTGKRGRLRLAFSPSEFSSSEARDAAVAVVDVLRATTVLPAAFAAGAARAVPADSVESATALLSALDRDSALLCGEREGRKIPGFDLGNSPLEYTPERVEKMTLVFCSTNGSRVMTRFQAAEEMVLASFVNVSAAAERLAAAGRDVLVVASGKLGRACIEDTALGGLLVSRLTALVPGLDPDDGARMALRLWEGWKEDVPGLLRGSEHGAYLAELGFDEDLEFCSRIDSVPVVPVMRDGRIGI